MQIITLPKGETVARDIYQSVGGDESGGPEAFAALVDAFYDNVEQNAVLRPLYPTGDADAMKEARENLALFLIQYFGGPALYAEKRGHPRLRMRHFPFTIGASESAAWMDCMRAALDTVPAFASHRPVMEAYFENAAQFLQNAPTPQE